MCDETLAPVRFEGKTYEIAPIFSDTCGDADRFLCHPDCVAEREGFYYRRYLQVPVNPTLPRYYPVFERVTRRFDLWLEFL